MILEYLIIILFIMALKKRSASILMFASMNLIHDLFFSGLDGLAYYGSAAFFDMVVYLSIDDKPGLDKEMKLICKITISLNIIGWLMWMQYLDPAPYDFAFIILNMYAIYILIKDEGIRHGDTGMDRWDNLVRLHNY